MFSEELEPMFVIHNISIVTADDITYFGDDVNIYPVFLPRAITIWECCLNWLKGPLFQTTFFVNLL